MNSSLIIFEIIESHIHIGWKKFYSIFYFYYKDIFLKANLKITVETAENIEETIFSSKVVEVFI